MVKPPRSHDPGRADEDEAVDLLRALARKQRGPERSERPEPDDRSTPQDGEPDKMEALRELAQKLDRQLRTPGKPSGDAPRGFGLFRGIALHDLWHTLRDVGSAVAARLAATRPRHGWLVRREARIVAAAAVAAVAVLLIGLLVWKLTAPKEAVLVPPIETQPSAPAQAPPKADVAAISKAMADCDAVASQDQDTLYFLILPMLPANKTDRTWAAIALQTVGNSFILLGSKDALDGLAGNTLVLRPGRYTFAILDSESGATYSWTSATGLSRLAKRDAGAVKTLKLGFDFSEAQTGAQWTTEFKRERGSCYWVSVLVRE